MDAEAVAAELHLELQTRQILLGVANSDDGRTPEQRALLARLRANGDANAAARAATTPAGRLKIAGA